MPTSGHAKERELGGGWTYTQIKHTLSTAWVETAAAEEASGWRVDLLSLSFSPVLLDCSLCVFVHCWIFVCFRVLTSKFCCHWPNPGHFSASLAPASPPFSPLHSELIRLVCMQVLKSLIKAQRQKRTLQGMRGLCFSTGLNSLFEMAKGWFIVHEKWENLHIFLLEPPAETPSCAWHPDRTTSYEKCAKYCVIGPELHGCVWEKWLQAAPLLFALWEAAGRSH